MDYTISLSSLTYPTKEEIVNLLDEITESDADAITGYVMNTDMNSIKNVTNANASTMSAAFATIFPKLMSDSEEQRLLNAIQNFKDRNVTND